MNNIQFWIWLLVIVITLIARMRKKGARPGNGTPTSTASPQEAPAEPTKSMTFEELLREIEAARKPEPKPEPVRPMTPVNYDDMFREEHVRTEQKKEIYGKPQETIDVYEKARQEAFLRPSLEETMKLEDTIVRFGQFKGYQMEERMSPAAEFAKEIRNPSGFKKAFIMSEILRRRF